MALTSWKSFKFFEASEVSLGDPDNADVFKKDLSCICTGSDSIFTGSHDGMVRILSRSCKVIRAFKAHDTGSITRMMQVEGTSLLVTIAQDLSSEPILKVWALDKLEKKTGIPRCVTTLGIQNQRKQYPISAFSALADLSQLAIGFANGSVTVVRGDLIHDRGARQRTVFESEEPITGVEFREGNTTTLYIATTARIMTLVISGRGQGQPARTIDEKGCAVGCMTIDKASGTIIVARDDAIYYYGPHGRGPYYNCDGKKTMIAAHRDYVAMAFPSASSSVAQSTLAAHSRTSAAEAHLNTTFIVLNTDFHIIAHLDTLDSQVEHCFIEWNDIFVLTQGGRLFRHKEKPLQQRLDLILQREDFILAIQIAQKAGLSATQQSVIFRKHGDYLYQRKDFETAMQQYLRAIENIEPSQVIRKFLDAQRIHNLVDYLEELHDHHLAGPDHTILLLNCYAKLKDVEKLENFIKAPGDIKFDLETAISMCRQGGYFDQAAYLARKHSEHDLVVSILIEDCKRYAEALAYICRLEPEVAFVNLMKYATVLLEQCSKDTTQILVDYYTGLFRPKKDAVVVTAAAAAPTSQPSSFAVSAVQNLASLLPLPYMSMDSGHSAGSVNQKTETRVVESQSTDPPLEYELPRPRSAFSAFLDHPDEFITFLEACIGSENVRGEDMTDLYTTLFEMYLHLANERGEDRKKEWEEKAKALIQGQSDFIDTSNVLLLSDLERFKDGTVLVREKQGLRFDIFRSYTVAKDTAGAIKALKKYGPEDPQLYPAALAYFASSERALEEAGPEFEAVLRKIDADGLMAPLQVIQTLSTSAVATIGLVKKYLQETVGRERDEIAKNRRMISTFRTDTIGRRAELERLKTTPTEFMATRCSSCGANLDMPTVYFMCKHSFHQRCLNIMDGEKVETVECPECAPQNASIRAIKKAQEENRERHQAFKDALARSKDGFTTIADWYGRGVMTSANTVNAG